MVTAEQLKQKLNEMTKSERAVASFYLTDPDSFMFVTLDEAASRVGVSTTTVLRFCRKLGFEGFKDFQKSLWGEAKLRRGLPDKFHRTVSDQNALLERTVMRCIGCIRESLEKMPQETLSRAVSLLWNAKRIYTFGMKESFALAHYAYTRLFTVRPSVALLDPVFRGEAEALVDLGKEDVCVVFLFHRYTKASLEVLKLLQKLEVKVILVTNPPYDDVLSPETVVLPCQADVGGIKNSAAASIVLWDYLCSALAVAGGEKALRHMEKTEEMFRFGDFLEK